MQVIVDTDAGTLTLVEGGTQRELPLYSTEGFEELSRQWIRVGWNEKYPYTFSWLGRPIIQLPDDMIRLQEVVYRLRPDVIVETGIAHGGSLVYSASLCKLMGRGRVIGVDVEIRPHNRAAIEAHELFEYITLVEGGSTDQAVVQLVKAQIKPSESVLVILDSNHTKQHVLNELESYHELVSEGGYIIATDGVMRQVFDVPRGRREWSSDHPAAAAQEFVLRHPEFLIEQPEWVFNESNLRTNVTHWPDAWIRRRKQH